MKKYFVIFFVIALAIFIIGVFSVKKNIGGDEISKTKLEEKYNVSDLKSKYQLDGMVLKSTPKNDPKDMIRVDIGEPGIGGPGDFTPKVTISRWDEVSFSLLPTDIAKIDPEDQTLDLSGGKIKLGTPKVDYIIYDLPIDTNNPEGGTEYEIDLKEKPDTNVIEFVIESQGLNFIYNPELTQAQKDKGMGQPENVIGSYAVYMSEKKINWEGGKIYRTGKVGQFYRPQMEDANGWKVWGELKITDGILSVTIPQDFLDKAVYPVRHAAGLTFGRITAGGNYNSALLNQVDCGNYTTGADITGATVNSITMVGRNLGDASSVKGLIFTNCTEIITTCTLITNAVGGATALPTGAYQWFTSNFASSPSLSNSTTYCIGGVSNDAASNDLFSFFDGTGGSNCLFAVNVYTTPATMLGQYNCSTDAQNVSAYVTYTASGGAPAVDNTQINISDQ